MSYHVLSQRKLSNRRSAPTCYRIATRDNVDGTCGQTPLSPHRHSIFRDTCEFVMQRYSLWSDRGVDGIERSRGTGHVYISRDRRIDHV